MPLTLIFSIKISILPSDCETHNILGCLRGSVSFACQTNLICGSMTLGGLLNCTWKHVICK